MLTSAFCTKFCIGIPDTDYFLLWRGKLLFNWESAKRSVLQCRWMERWPTFWEKFFFGKRARGWGKRFLGNVPWGWEKPFLGNVSRGRESLFGKRTRGREKPFFGKHTHGWEKPFWETYREAERNPFWETYARLRETLFVREILFGENVPEDRRWQLHPVEDWIAALQVELSLNQGVILL